jgi:hypothetical protein
MPPRRWRTVPRTTRRRCWRSSTSGVRKKSRARVTGVEACNASGILRTTGGLGGRRDGRRFFPQRVRHPGGCRRVRRHLGRHHHQRGQRHDRHQRIRIGVGWDGEAIGRSVDRRCGRDRRRLTAPPTTRVQRPAASSSSAPPTATGSKCSPPTGRDSLWSDTGILSPSRQSTRNGNDV